MQAGSLHDPVPARSAPSGWGPPGREETEPNPDGERPGEPSVRRCNARAKRWLQAQTSSDRVCFAAARFSTRRSFSVFCAGFLPVFFGFADPFFV